MPPEVRKAADPAHRPMSRRLKDGTIAGVVDLTHLRVCARCRQEEVTVQVTSVELPDGVRSDDKRIIAVAGTQLGITCGCYAKAHRQFVHIMERRKR